MHFQWLTEQLPSDEMLATVVMDASRDTESGDRAVAARWSELRRSLDGQGITPEMSAVLEEQVLQPTRLDLNALVTGMHPMLSRLIGEQVELVPSLAADLSNVRADPGQLEQVLKRLASRNRRGLCVSDLDGEKRARLGGTSRR